MLPAGGVTVMMLTEYEDAFMHSIQEFHVLFIRKVQLFMDIRDVHDHHASESYDQKKGKCQTKIQENRAQISRLLVEHKYS